MSVYSSRLVGHVFCFASHALTWPMAHASPAAVSSDMDGRCVALTTRARRSPALDLKVCGAREHLQNMGYFVGHDFGADNCVRDSVLATAPN